MRATPASRPSPRWSIESIRPAPSTASRQRTPGLPAAQVDTLEALDHPTEGRRIPQIGPVEVVGGRVELTEYPLGFRGAAAAMGGGGLQRCRTQSRG